ncbi:hypothetical protein D3C81_1574000 [compost metagenome]
MSPIVAVVDWLNKMSEIDRSIPKYFFRYVIFMGQAKKKVYASNEKLPSPFFCVNIPCATSVVPYAAP